MWSYQLRYVRCGKSNCRPCRAGFGHGPYWYGYEHRGGRVYSKYFGKRPTSTFVFPEQQPEPQIDRRWAFHGRMDYRTALRILGFDQKPNPTALHARWRALVNEYHPDKGGDVRVCAAINVAYIYLK